jgi:transposase-like protein
MGRKQNESAEMVWRDRLTRFERSNLSVKQFCDQEGISDPAFYQWRKRLRKSQPQQRPKAARQSGSQGSHAVESFVPVSVSNSTFAEVEFPNGIRIRVPATNAEALRVAIRTSNEMWREVR